MTQTLSLPIENAPPVYTWRNWAAAALALAALIVIVHGISLRGGLFMDDWAHLRQLREAGWNLRDLVAACRLELVGGIAEMWFMPEVTLRFFRPVAFGLMKLTYVLSGWSPLAMHAASLCWHLLVCLLLMRLLERLGARRLHAWFATALFAVHPGHVATVQWIAVQTELIVTTFLLVATLAFAEFRGWPGSANILFARGGHTVTPSEHEALASVPARHEGKNAATEVRHAGRSWLFGLACAASYALALGCRENAIMFPLVMAATEPMARRTARKRAIGLYALLGLVAVAYLAVRWYYLGGVQVPPRPYIYPPTDPGFLRFIFDKLCYYLIGEFLLVPCIPIGGLTYFLTMPWMFYGMSAAVGALLLWSVVRWWNRPPGWLGPAWIVLFCAPLLPAFASPHHLYLPGVGAAVVTWLVLRQLTRSPAKSGAPHSRAPSFTAGDGALPSRAPSFTAGQLQATRPRSTAFTRKEVVYTLTSLGLVGFVLISAFLPVLAIDTGQRVEDTIAAEVAAAPRALKDGDTLYVVNLPIIAHYLKLIVEERTGLRDLRVVPLTWAPRVLGLFGSNARAEYEWQDEKTLDVRIARDRWFSAVLGQLTDESLGRDTPVRADAPVVFVDCKGEVDFTVRLLEGDPSGIDALRFEFRDPPLRPGSHVFWGSNIRWAYQLAP